MESFVRMAGVFVGCFLALAGIGFMLRVPIGLGWSHTRSARAHFGLDQLSDRNEKVGGGKPLRNVSSPNVSS